MDGSYEMLLRDRFVNGMAHAAFTVSVVTTNGAAGQGGVTVSAMTSVSADMPNPTLLICVHHKSLTAPMIAKNGVFCVNVLRQDQAHIADTFAGRVDLQGEDKFTCAKWHPMGSGAARLVDGLVAFDCRIQSAERVGTHHVFVGAVEEMHLSDSGHPLVYSNRAYCRADPL